MTITCINDKFGPEWDAYFIQHGIVTPIANNDYTVRDFIHYPVGEVGVLLNEIRNPDTPRRSALNPEIFGTAEQAWAISRFVCKDGSSLKEHAAKQKTSQMHAYSSL